MKDSISKSYRPHWNREPGVFYVCEFCGKPATLQVSHYDPPITMDDERQIVDGVIPDSAIKIEYCCNECFGRGLETRIQNMSDDLAQFIAREVLDCLETEKRNIK